MDAADDVGAGQYEQVVVALEILAVCGEALAPEVGFREGVLLDHGAHGTVEDEDAFGQELAEFGAAVCLHGGRVGVWSSLAMAVGCGHEKRRGKPQGFASAVGTVAEPGCENRVSQSQRSSARP